jgi:hypothetical protein
MAAAPKEPAKVRKLDLAEFGSFVDEFKGESDRAAVILGAAKIDLLLYQILTQFLLPSTGGRDELLDGDAALGTFSAKIHIAYRLGLIDAEFTRALQLVRKIRNAFAHEVAGCNLGSGAHRDRVKELVAPIKHKNVFSNVAANHFGGKDDPSTHFRVALTFLAGRLDVLLCGVEPLAFDKPLSILGPKALAMGEVPKG